MRIKMGTVVHLAAYQARYRSAIADALRRELGPTHQPSRRRSAGQALPNVPQSTGFPANAGQAASI